MLIKFKSWMKNDIKKHKLFELVKSIGGVKKLSEQLGIHHTNISKWLRTEMKVPLHHAVTLERISSGKFKAADFRPDVFNKHTL